MRLSRFVQSVTAGLPTSMLYKSFRNKRIKVNGRRAAPEDRLHEGDLVAYNPKSDSICTLADLHAEQREFPHCIADGIFVLREDDVKPGDDIAKAIG